MTTSLYPTKLLPEARKRLREKFERPPKSKAEKIPTLERNLQKACIKYLALQHPDALFFHVPNEGKRKVQTGKALKAEGMIRGLPDIMILEEWGERAGLAIELKVGYNYPSDEQLILMERLSARRWVCAIVWEFDTFKEIVDDYLGLL